VVAALNPIEFRDLVFEPDDMVRAALRRMGDDELQASVVGAWDWHRRQTGEFRDQVHRFWMLIVDERDERRRANEMMTDALFPVVGFREVTEDGPAVDSAGDQGGCPE
jgi:hypothetical protein